MPDVATTRACPRCGTKRSIYKCECDGDKHEPVVMPVDVAARLRELHRKAFPPRRLTATPAGKVTVWVERDLDGDRVWLRPCNPVRNNEASNPEGWADLSRYDWGDLVDTVDKYLEALDRVAPRKERRDA